MKLAVCLAGAALALAPLGAHAELRETAPVAQESALGGSSVYVLLALIAVAIAVAATDGDNDPLSA